MLTRKDLWIVAKEARSVSYDAYNESRDFANEDWKIIFIDLSQAAKDLAHAADVVDAYKARQESVSMEPPVAPS